MKHISIVLFILLGQMQGHGQGRQPKFFEVAAHGKYQTGWYTLLDGTRHAGRLRLWQTPAQNSVQVDQGKADPINLMPEQLRHFTMGTDSFTIARDIAVAGIPTIKPFGETDIYRVVLTGKLQILEHDQLVPGTGAQYGPTHAGAWVIRGEGRTDLVAVPARDKEFAQHMAPFFVDNPALAQRIRAGLVGPTDFKRIVYSYVFRKEIDQVTYEEAATLFR